MEFWIGGAYQGQNEIAIQEYKKRFGQDPVIANCSCASFDEVLQADVILSFHLLIRTMEENGQECNARVLELLNKKPAVITMDEVGCGIVPVDAEERRYRESAGNAGQRIAAASEHVYRVICGIASKIK